jgi:Na+-transporting methylmalonyl-CoA/oxaloacetate decarboxylase gamma subunit
MKINKLIISIFASLIVLIAGFQLSAQGDRLMVINEFLVINENNKIDDYGNHSAWIELFNPAYNPVDISKMYITNEPGNPTKYRIPDAGSSTIVEPRGFLILYADEKPNRGVFHVNFILEETGYIGLYDSDGKTLMDEIYYPQQKVDVTYGRVVDGETKWDYLEKSTPNSSNVTELVETAAELFGRLDPSGLALTIISMTVVFSALILLFFVYKFVGNLNQKKYVIKVKRPSFLKNEQSQKQSDDENIVLSGEINAAIAMALHLYVTQTHDFENTTMTIKKVSRNYSPWSSKIYGLRNNPKNR